MASSCNKTILIVDDEEALSHMLSDTLSNEGYQVLEANSAARALGILKSTKVDLMISDIIMPGMGGFELVDKVNELYPRVKIQLVTGYSDQVRDDVVLHKKILYKPYRHFDVLERVKSLLQSEDE
ncbi:MAG: response regulator [Gammaproteobacteria bacterium]|nr:response regulator [Gammaproteobacteria bacterium]